MTDDQWETALKYNQTIQGTACWFAAKFNMDPDDCYQEALIYVASRHVSDVSHAVFSAKEGLYRYRQRVRKFTDNEVSLDALLENSE